MWKSCVPPTSVTPTEVTVSVALPGTAKRTYNAVPASMIEPGAPGSVPAASLASAAPSIVTVTVLVGAAIVYGPKTPSPGYDDGLMTTGATGAGGPRGPRANTSATMPATMR